MKFGVQRQQTLLVMTELVIWRYANAFIFTNQSEFDFGIAYVQGLGAYRAVNTLHLGYKNISVNNVQLFVLRATQNT
jgi:hypothetical protein